MLEYTIGTLRTGGTSKRYLRIKSDAPIAVTEDVVSFTKKQVDKISVYDCIIGDLLRETEVGGYFYRWYVLESALIETDHTPPIKNELEGIAPSALVAPIAFVTLAESGQIDDVTAGEHAELFSPWASNIQYETGNLRSYNGQLYRCIQSHISQGDWTPDTAVSLWTKVSDPAEEWPVWSQPIGAQDAYNAGDKVSHNGKHWISEVAPNVWEPGVYGWAES